MSIERPLLHCHISAKDQWEVISFPLCVYQSAFVVHQEYITCNSQALQCTTPGFRREVNENCSLLGYYSASSGNYLPIFLLDSWTSKMGPLSCPETSVRNYNYSLSENQEERSSLLKLFSNQHYTAVTDG